MQSLQNKLGRGRRQKTFETFDDGSYISDKGNGLSADEMLAMTNQNPTASTPPDEIEQAPKTPKRIGRPLTKKAKKLPTISMRPNLTRSLSSNRSLSTSPRRVSRSMSADDESTFSSPQDSPNKKSLHVRHSSFSSSLSNLQPQGAQFSPSLRSSPRMSLTAESSETGEGSSARSSILRRRTLFGSSCNDSHAASPQRKTSSLRRPTLHVSSFNESDAASPQGKTSSLRGPTLHVSSFNENDIASPQARTSSLRRPTLHVSSFNENEAESPQGKTSSLRRPAPLAAPSNCSLTEAMLGYDHVEKDFDENQSGCFDDDEEEGYDFDSPPNVTADLEAQPPPASKTSPENPKDSQDTLRSEQKKGTKSFRLGRGKKFEAVDSGSSSSDSVITLPPISWSRSPQGDPEESPKSKERRLRISKMGRSRQTRRRGGRRPTKRSISPQKGAHVKAASREASKAHTDSDSDTEYSASEHGGDEQGAQFMPALRCADPGADPGAHVGFDSRSDDSGSEQDGGYIPSTTTSSSPKLSLHRDPIHIEASLLGGTFDDQDDTKRASERLTAPSIVDHDVDVSAMSADETVDVGLSAVSENIEEQMSLPKADTEKPKPSLRSGALGRMASLRIGRGKRFESMDEGSYVSDIVFPIATNKEAISNPLESTRSERSIGRLLLGTLESPRSEKRGIGRLLSPKKGKKSAEDTTAVASTSRQRRGRGPVSNQQGAQLMPALCADLGADTDSASDSSDESNFTSDHDGDEQGAQFMPALRCADPGADPGAHVDSASESDDSGLEQEHGYLPSVATSSFPRPIILSAPSGGDDMFIDKGDEKGNLELQAQNIADLDVDYSQMGLDENEDNVALSAVSEKVEEHALTPKIDAKKLTPSRDHFRAGTLGRIASFRIGRGKHFESMDDGSYISDVGIPIATNEDEQDDSAPLTVSKEPKGIGRLLSPRRAKKLSVSMHGLIQGRSSPVPTMEISSKSEKDYITTDSPSRQKSKIRPKSLSEYQGAQTMPILCSADQEADVDSEDEQLALGLSNLDGLSLQRCGAVNVPSQSSISAEDLLGHGGGHSGEAEEKDVDISLGAPSEASLDVDFCTLVADDFKHGAPSGPSQSCSSFGSSLMELLDVDEEYFAASDPSLEFAKEMGSASMSSFGIEKANASFNGDRINGCMSKLREKRSSASGVDASLRGGSFRSTRSSLSLSLFVSDSAGETQFVNVDTRMPTIDSPMKKRTSRVKLSRAESTSKQLDLSSKLANLSDIDASLSRPPSPVKESSTHLRPRSPVRESSRHSRPRLPVKESLRHLRPRSPVKESSKHSQPRCPVKESSRHSRSQPLRHSPRTPLKEPSKISTSSPVKESSRHSRPHSPIREPSRHSRRSTRTSTNLSPKKQSKTSVKLEHSEKSVPTTILSPHKEDSQRSSHVHAPRTLVSSRRIMAEIGEIATQCLSTYPILDLVEQVSPSKASLLLAEGVDIKQHNSPGRGVSTVGKIEMLKQEMVASTQRQGTPSSPRRLGQTLRADKADTEVEKETSPTCVAEFSSPRQQQRIVATSPRSLSVRNLSQSPDRQNMTMTMSSQRNGSSDEINYSPSSRRLKLVGSGSSTKRLERSSSAKRFERSGSTKRLERSSSAKRFERSGIAKKLECAGSARKLERSESVKKLERSGSAKKLERLGSARGVRQERTGGTRRFKPEGSGGERDVDRSLSSSRILIAAGPGVRGRD